MLSKEKSTLLGKNITHAAVKTITEAGTAHIPEDRQKDGVVLLYSIEDNLILNTWYKAPFAQNSILQRKIILENAINWLRNLISAHRVL